MDLIVDALACESRPATARARIGIYNIGPALPRGVLHARAHRRGRTRHAAHGRQHASLHGDGGAGPDRILRHRRRIPARTGPRRDGRHPARRPQPGRDPDRAVGARPGPPPGAATPAARRRSIPRTATAAEADVHLAPRLGTNVAAAERAPPSGDRERAHRPGLHRAPTPSASSALARRRREVDPGPRRRQSPASPSRQLAATRPRSSGHADPRLDGAPGRLPVDPGDGRRRPGQQPPSDPRLDRKARLPRSSR